MRISTGLPRRTALLAAVGLFMLPVLGMSVAAEQDFEPSQASQACSTEAATSFAGGLYAGLLARGEEVSPRALDRIPPPGDPCAVTFYFAAAAILRERATPQLEPNSTGVDCGRFLTWQQAQIFYILDGGPFSDQYRLDANQDGIACDGLPGSPVPPR